MKRALKSNLPPGLAMGGCCSLRTVQKQGSTGAPAEAVEQEEGKKFLPLLNVGVWEQSPGWHGSFHSFRSPRCHIGFLVCLPPNNLPCLVQGAGLGLESPMWFRTRVFYLKDHLLPDHLTQILGSAKGAVLARKLDSGAAAGGRSWHWPLLSGTLSPEMPAELSRCSPLNARRATVFKVSF